jgi:hypothetical protein
VDDAPTAVTVMVTGVFQFAPVNLTKLDGLTVPSVGSLTLSAIVTSAVGWLVSTTVFGDPSKPGIYVIRNRFAPGSRVQTHKHTGTVAIVVPAAARTPCRIRAGRFRHGRGSCARDRRRRQL